MISLRCYRPCLFQYILIFSTGEEREKAGGISFAEEAVMRGRLQELLFVHIVLARCERALAATLGDRGMREEESAAPVRDGIV